MARRPIPWILTVPFAAVVAFAASSAAAQSYWFESYERAVELTRAGRYEEASTLLDAVLKEQPAPIPALRVPGARFIDYVPYHFRARIDLAIGKPDSASHYLNVSEAFGEPRFNRECALETTKLREALALRAAVRAQDGATLTSVVEPGNR
jgi:hypothetical protein